MKMKRWFSLLLVVTVLMTSLPSKILAKDFGRNAESELTSLIVETEGGKKYSLLNNEVESIDLEGTYSFVAEFTSSEQIDTVSITSTKGTAISYLDAEWDGNVFRTTGYFNNDENYIPGKIGVKYTLKSRTEVDVEGQVNWDLISTSLGGNVTANNVLTSTNSTSASVDISSLLQSEASVAIDVFVDAFDESTGANLNDWLGQYQELEKLTQYAIDGTNYVLYLDFSDPSTYAVLIRDTSGSKIWKAIIEEAGEYKAGLKKVAENLGTVSSVANTYLEFAEVEQETDELRSEVDSRVDLSGEDKEKLYETITSYENDRNMFTLMMTVMPAIVAASGGTMAGPTLLFNGLLSVLGASADFFWSYRIGMLSGCDPNDVNFVSDAHGVPLTSMYLKEHDYKITEGGSYYVDCNEDFSVEGVNVTICTHEYSPVIYNNGGTVTLANCFYAEDESGAVVETGGYADVRNNEGSVYVDKAACSILCNEYGYVTVNGGQVSSIKVYGDGEVIINGGNVNFINNEAAYMRIEGGSVGRITNEEGTVEINGNALVPRTSGHAIDNESGNITIRNGTIRGKDYGDTIYVESMIYNDTNGTMSLIDCTVIGGRSIDEFQLPIFNNGTLSIRNSTVSSWDMEGSGACISNSGTTEIFGGVFLGSIGSGFTDDGEKGLVIHDGEFTSKAGSNISNSGSLLIEDGRFEVVDADAFSNNISSHISNVNSMVDVLIKNGTFTCNGNDCIDISGDLRTMTTLIEGGTFYSDVGSCLVNSGKLSSVVIRGGSFTSDKPPIQQGCITQKGDGTLQIDGGTFNCNEGSCLFNQGVATINDGIFTSDKNYGADGCITNVTTSENGKMYINGGVFDSNGFKCFANRVNGTLIISSGKILASNGLSAIEGKGCTLLIGKETDIEISAKFGLFRGGLSNDDSFNLIIDRDEGYQDGVNYFETPDSNPLYLSVEELENIDFAYSSNRKYLHIVAAEESDDNMCKVSLNTNGGTINSGFVNGYVIGIGATLPTDVTKVGFKFAGWYESIDFSGNAVTSISSEATGDKTYYAKWLSSNIAISEVTVNGTLGTINDRVITIVLPYGSVLPTNSSEISITPVAGASVENLTTNDNGATWTFDVLAEDKVTKASYIIRVSTNSNTSQPGGSDSNPPYIPPAKTPSQQAVDQIEDAKEGSTVKVTLHTGSTNLDKEVFEKLAGRDVTLEIDLPGSITWTLNGENIPETVNFSDLDLGVSMNTSSIPVDVINAVASGLNSVQITLDHEGEFAFPLNLNVPLDGESAGRWANLYCYDENSEILDFEMASAISGDGGVALQMTNAGPYVILIDDKSHEMAFTDLGEDQWYENAVRYAYLNGIMEGMSETKYSPNTRLSRAQAVQILYNLEGQPGISDENLSYPYSDVDAQAWYGNAVYWARNTGVATGDGDGTFRPTDSITRQEFAQMLYNYARYKNYDLTADGNLSTFPDVGSIADWAVTAMSWANGNKLINGHENGTIDAAGTTIRAQAASMLMKFDQNLVVN